MVPGLEEIGIQMLLNERDVIERGSEHIHLAGINDAHLATKASSIEKAAAGTPRDEFSILISHTPEVYKDAAHAGFDVMISGHTHGGQICLPGGIPITGPPPPSFRDTWVRDPGSIATCPATHLAEQAHLCAGALQLPTGNHAASTQASS